MRLLVIDHSLINLRGHHFNYNAAIYRAARGSAVTSHFFCHQACSMEVLNELPSSPVFSVDTYSLISTLSTKGLDHIVDDYQRHREVFLQELTCHISRQLQPDDLLLFHTIQLPELDAICSWYDGLEQRPRLAIILRFDIYAGLRYRVLPEKSREMYNECIQQLGGMEPDRVRFYTDTRAMADQYRHSGIPFYLIPIPLDGHTAQGRAETSDGKLNFVFLGDAFRHKGFGLLVDAIPAVLQSNPSVQFTIQVTNAEQPYEELRRYPNIRLVEQRPSEEDYYTLLQEASALLLPYDPSIYRFQSSHIFIESVIRQIPVICSDNGSMLPDLQQCGMTDLVFSPYQAAALADKVNFFCRDPEAMTVAFIAATWKLADFHSGKNFIRMLIQETDIAIPASQSPSELERVIPPEISNDELYHLIQQLAADDEIRTVLEIGSSAGGGSTEAFVKGLRNKKGQPRLFCMEVSQPRFKTLRQRYADVPFVRCYNVSSVPLTSFPPEKEVSLFYQHIQTNLNHYPLEQVLGWLQQDIEYVKSSGADANGIARIRQENGIATFDMVLIDGSEFTGKAELKEVYGARWILLDDVNAYKNYENYHLLKNDPDYELYQENWNLRNGYAVFRKKGGELPVHFFTIVLNGMPFIGHHIDVFRHLPFKWHWHIVEGVADLVGDTAWSKPSGGHIADSQHQNGLSIDGTTEYIDEISKMFPDNITVYRKEQGKFWHGKNEMVNAPLAKITEECLLWQVDVDEFWKYEHIVTARDMFLKHPEKTAAFYWCHFFAGGDIVVASRNCYSQNPAFEWLRTWRYLPGDQWAAHEPPRLHRGATEHSAGVDVAGINPLMHAETEANGLVFQHFAYVLPEQLKFKESYYGYHGAYYQWLNLQKQNRFPQLLRDYFSWVQDDTTVTSARASGVLPEPLPSMKPDNRFSAGQPFNIVLDGVFLQLAQSGIARVWLSLLQQWQGSRFARHLHILDRGRTFPRVDGYHYVDVPTHDYNNLQNDRSMLQDICDTLNADLFVSTYYTTPLSTPSLLMVHDMIPEVFLGENRLTVPMWIEKQHALHYASEYVAVSNNSAHDLIRLEPSIASRPVHVVHNGVSKDFKTAGQNDIEEFCSRHSIHKPYYLFSGFRGTYKNFEYLMKTVSSMPESDCFVIVTTGSPELEPEFHQYVNNGRIINVGWLSSEELRTAYSGALALLYPSLYEGFGLPILEAMRCGCPVITSNYGATKEIAGDAAFLVNPADAEELKTAISGIRKQHIREYFINKGYEHAQRYSWKRAASGILRIMIRMVGGNEGFDNLILEEQDNR